MNSSIDSCARCTLHDVTVCETKNTVEWKSGGEIDNKTKIRLVGISISRKKINI